MVTDRKALTLKEIAGPILPVSEKTLRREADAGRLKTIRLRGRVLVKAEDLTAYLASLSGSSPQ